MYRTLGDIKQKEEKKEGKKSAEFYSGGSKSGMAVSTPEDVQNIIGQAERGGPISGKSVKITMYQDGFMVNDGEFRNYTDERNKEFMSQLKKGQVPKELQALYKGDLDVSLEDKTSEKFEPKLVEKKPEPFGGSATRIEDSKSVGLGIKDAAPPKIDSSKETTKLNLRLHTGKTVNIEVNTDSKVSEIYAFVSKSAPVKGKFVLMASGFPPKSIESSSQTVKEAGICSSTLIQKLIQDCLLYTSPSPRDLSTSRMPSSA
eukprot:TRINITY_DN938_c0_g1_i5.p1 TRINITY_DN938_c0_g1~~TRINITY_DN938_c0_g1_i5.p1  ORF type:complete len:259 (-),score=47.39 TRINITY_DN938_c0_g1_i5:23-799(-)